MSVQRGKVKTVPRSRGQRVPVNSANFPKAIHHLPTQQEDGLGIYSNTELTYMLARHVIGNIGEVTTTENSKLLGVVKAISPSGDLGLVFAYSPQKNKNGQVNVVKHTVSLSNWKMVRISDIKFSDCLIGDTQADLESVNDCEFTSATATDKELVPFFASSEAINDCDLNQGGFPAEEMFKTNKELFSVSTTYNPDLSEYTTPIDRSAPNFPETEAWCTKIARYIEDNHSPHASIEDSCEDEEAAFSAVARVQKDSSVASRVSGRSPRTVNEVSSSNRGDALSNVSRQMAHVSVHTASLTAAESSSSQDSHPDNAKASETIKVDSVYPAASMNRSTDHVASEKTSVGEVSDVQTPIVSSEPESPSAPPNVSASFSATESKVKKSKLDPNAPEFQPMSLQYANLSGAVQLQPQLQSALAGLSLNSSQVIHPVVNANHSGQLSIPALTAFVATQQPQLYAPAPVSYGTHSDQMSHMLSGAIQASAANNLVSHMRGGSLPPYLSQQGLSAALNSTPSLLLPHAQQPGITMPQIVNPQPPLVAGPNNGGRFSVPSSSVCLTRQRSNESAGTPHSSAYGTPQNLSMSTFQSPVYQLSQPGGTIPLWLAGHPQVGLHFVPSAGSSPLVVGNMPMSQTSGQPIYPTHAMLHVQPTQLPVPAVQLEQAPPSSTPQQNHHQPVFQAHSGHFQDHHHIQVPSYAPMIFTTRQPPPNSFYHTAPSVLTAPNAINTSVQAGLLPLVNQPNPQHAAGVNIGHHQPNLDPGLVSASLSASQFPHAGCQPSHLLQQYSAAHQQLLQAQQLAANQHVNQQSLQPSAYQNFVGLVASGGNLPSQSH
ncbi:uncharacterized protein DEA37_0007849 [Paragonimus westermani]|uniref:LsmAD domain-containing protein n=1 Tax=Paragonimus westermani TaxID=34504 RepID=A0A5J4NGM5_9TREM|nr:uncharacterized protein DEA37_0007849 [Paragonimus westermani]